MNNYLIKLLIVLFNMKEFLTNNCSDCSSYNRRIIRSESFKNNLSTSQIPLDLVLKLEDERADLSSIFVNYQELQFSSRINENERSNVVIAKSAICQPELQTVRLENGQMEPGLYYHPTCTRIERCGGCCSHHLLACQPISDYIEIVNFEVKVMQYDRDHDKFIYIGKQIVPIERHNKCKCVCRVQPEDCNHLQIYQPNSCACVCRNQDEEDKCNSLQSNLHLWDPNTCTCQCREQIECNSGFYFDQYNCNCRPLQDRRPLPLTPEEIDRLQNERRRLRISPIPPT